MSTTQELLAANERYDALVARLESLAQEWADDRGIINPASKYTRDVLVAELRRALVSA